MIFPQLHLEQVEVFHGQFLSVVLLGHCVSGHLRCQIVIVVSLSPASIAVLVVRILLFIRMERRKEPNKRQNRGNSEN